MTLVYLIQPSKLINTNRFKIGCSRHSDLKRIQSYGSGSKILIVSRCSINPFDVERKIRNSFLKKFKQCQGNEYFEGDENEAYTEFLKIINTMDKPVKKCFQISTYEDLIKYTNIDSISRDMKNAYIVKLKNTSETITVQKTNNRKKIGIKYFLQDLEGQYDGNIEIHERSLLCSITSTLTDRNINSRCKYCKF